MGFGMDFAAVCMALNLCMKAHPPVPPEYRQHPEADEIAGQVAVMMCAGLSAVEPSQIEPHTLGLILKWLDQAQATQSGSPRSA